METKLQNLRDTDAWKLGHSGEQFVADLLKESGYYVIPSYDYTGDEDNKAPKLQGQEISYVLPDLDASISGDRVWAEVKTKTEATYHRITGRWEHGIPRRHYDDYRKVQEITGCEVWLYVYELAAKEVLVGKLDELKKQARFWEGSADYGYGGMVYFARDDFQVFARVVSE